MKRDYSFGTSEENFVPKFFEGIEVEKTAAHNKFTLFCLGTLSLEEIVEQTKKGDYEHIYLNHNHSFLTDAYNKIKFLIEKYYVTYEFFCYNDILKIDNPKLIHLLSLEFPYFEMKTNLSVKIDDAGFNQTNSGVWVINNNSIENHKTSWDEYKGDNVIEL